jgi:hypothetical protein
MLKTFDDKYECTFECTFVEFDKDYEVLNYIIWRQLDCIRNTTTLLFKCLKNDEILDGKDPVSHVCLVDMTNALRESNGEELCFVYGTLMKKQLYRVETQDDTHVYTQQTDSDFELTTKKHIGYTVLRTKSLIQNIDLKTDFNANVHKYVYNKFL